MFYHTTSWELIIGDVFTRDSSLRQEALVGCFVLVAIVSSGVCVWGRNYIFNLEVLYQRSVDSCYVCGLYIFRSRIRYAGPRPGLPRCWTVYFNELLPVSVCVCLCVLDPNIHTIQYVDDEFRILFFKLTDRKLLSVNVYALSWNEYWPSQQQPPPVQYTAGDLHCDPTDHIYIQ